MNLIDKIAAEQAPEPAVDFRAGDTLRVHAKIVEGEKERIQVFEGNLQAFDQRLFRFPHPNPGIVKFLVGLVRAIRIPNLALQVVVLFCFKLANAFPGCPLCVGIDVHLDHSISDCLANLLLRRT